MQFASDFWGIAWALLVAVGVAAAAFLWSAERRAPKSEDGPKDPAEVRQSLLWTAWLRRLRNVWQGLLRTVRRAGFLLLAPLLFLVLFPFAAPFPWSVSERQHPPADELVGAIVAHGKAVERLAKAEEALAERIRPTDCASCGGRPPLWGSVVLRWVVAIVLLVGGLAMFWHGLSLIRKGWLDGRESDSPKSGGETGEPRA